MGEVRTYLLFTAWIVLGIYALLWVTFTKFDGTNKLETESMFKIPQDFKSRVPSKDVEEILNKKVGLQRSLLGIYDSSSYGYYSKFPEDSYYYYTSEDDDYEQDRIKQVKQGTKRKHKRRRHRNRRRKNRRKTVHPTIRTTSSFKNINEAFEQFRRHWTPNWVPTQQRPWENPKLAEMLEKQYTYPTTIKPTFPQSTTENYYKQFYDDDVSTNAPSPTPNPYLSMVMEQYDKLKQLFDKELADASKKENAGNHTSAPENNYRATVRLWNYRPQAEFLKSGNTTVLLRSHSRKGFLKRRTTSKLITRTSIILTTHNLRVQMRNKWQDFYRAFLNSRSGNA